MLRKTTTDVTFEGEAGGVQRRSFTVTVVLREEVSGGDVCEGGAGQV